MRRGEPHELLACIKKNNNNKKNYIKKKVASNVPMSSREDAARQMRSSRHPYLHHWLRGSSEHQWPRTVACLRKIGSLSSRLDACALISSHGAAMKSRLPHTVRERWESRCWSCCSCCKTHQLRPEAILKYFRQTFLRVTWDVLPYVYIAPPIGPPTIFLPATDEQRRLLISDQVWFFTIFYFFRTHFTTLQLKKPRRTTWHLPDTCPQPSFHSTDVHPGNRPQDGGVSPGNGAGNCLSPPLCIPPSAPRRTQGPSNLNPTLLN